MVDDLYHLLKATKEEKVLAVNLQNLLLTISGEVDPKSISEGGTATGKWQDAGVITNGKLSFRAGEHALISTHFKLFRFNRQSMKKPVKNFAHKTAV